jgi:hypothetical protein
MVLGWFFLIFVKNLSPFMLYAGTLIKEVGKNIRHGDGFG